MSRAVIRNYFRRHQVQMCALALPVGAVALAVCGAALILFLLGVSFVVQAYPGWLHLMGRWAWRVLLTVVSLGFAVVVGLIVLAKLELVDD